MSKLWRSFVLLTLERSPKIISRSEIIFGRSTRAASADRAENKLERFQIKINKLHWLCRLVKGTALLLSLRGSRFQRDRATQYSCRFATFLLGIALTAALGACGYQFQGAGSILPLDVHRVSIPLAENISTETGFSRAFTEALRDRFDRFGVVTVVDEGEQADAVLKTRILKVTRGSQSVTSETDTALQQNSTLTVWGELRRTNGGVLWRNPTLEVTRGYGTTSDSVVTSSADFASGGLGAGDLGQLSTREIQRGQEQETLNLLAEDAAKIIYDQAVAPDF